METENRMEWARGVAARLQAQRGQRTQEKFAVHAGIPQSTVARYERGEIPKSWRVLAALVENEGVDLHDLLRIA